MKTTKTVAKPAAYAVAAILCVVCAAAVAVPAIPNKAVARGTVVEYCITSPGASNARGPALYKVVISVESTEDVADNSNFLKDKIWQDVTFWTRGKISSELVGKKVRATVEYRGDERGGRFCLPEIEVLKWRGQGGFLC